MKKIINAQTGEVKQVELTADELAEWEVKRSMANKKHDPREKQLLKD